MGGKCFDNVSRIDKDDIVPTVKHLETIVGISFQDRFLGSVGKKPTSGDIDLAIDATVDTSVLANKLVDKLGEKNVRRIGKLLTCSFPVSNKKTNVQIDFLQGDIEWLKLLYHSSNSSEYSGAHRNGVIRAILRVRNCKYVYNLHEIVEKTKYTWSPTKGLCLVCQKRKPTSTGYTKTWETTVLEVVSFDKIPATIFNNTLATNTDLDSLESLVSAINKYYNAAEDIFEEIAKEFLSMTFDKEYTYPACISKYIKG